MTGSDKDDLRRESNTRHLWGWNLAAPLPAGASEAASQASRQAARLHGGMSGPLRAFGTLFSFELKNTFIGQLKAHG